MWQAKFSNGEILNEIDENGREVLFRKVLDRLETLDSLSVIIAGKKFTVIMKNCQFLIENLDNSTIAQFSILDVDVSRLINIRPIYFIRETVKVSAIPQSQLPAVNFVALGFQANLGATNIQRYLKIFPDGVYSVMTQNE